MDKQQIISFINEQLASGKITKDELNALTNESVVSPSVPSQVFQSETQSQQPQHESSKSLINVFYSIGATIAIVGVGILVGQNWNEIGFVGRILVSLGISFATYVAGLVMRGQEHRVLSQVMFIISTALAPFGVFVLLSEASIDFDSTVQLMIACGLSIIYGFALFLTRRNILVLITIGFVTWAYYALILKMFGINNFDFDYIKWATMLLGASYLLIAYGYQSVWRSENQSDEWEKRGVQNVLYGLGTLAVLGSGIFIGGAFDLVFIAMIFAAFYGSIYLKSRAMLTLGALFLTAHIIKLTSEYFIDSIGWPVALIAVGFIIIGVGYMTFYLNRKFISN